MLALYKRIKSNKSEQIEVPQVYSESEEETLDSFFERTGNSRFLDENTQNQLRDLDLLAQIKSLGNQKKIPMKTNIFTYYEDLHTKQQISADLFELIMTILAAPATQVSVERAFSGLALLLQPHRLNMKDTTIDDVLVCGLNKELIHTVNFEEMELRTETES
jgi:hypothetical protein